MNFQKLYPSYERKAFRILLKAFRDFSKKIPFEFLTPDNAQNVISITIKQSNLEKALFKVHYTIGNHAGRLQLKEFQKWEMEIKKIKPSSYPLFSKAFQTWLVDYYSKFGGENIKLLTETYVASVVSEIKKSTDNNETLEQMRDRIIKAVDSPNFYNWQAMRIARTETTFAVNAGTEISGDFTVIEMQKRWMSMRDGRERPSHLTADNQIVGKDELFIVGGEKLRYPGDRQNGATAKNLVNCLCARTFIPKSNPDGSFILNI